MKSRFFVFLLLTLLLIPTFVACDLHALDKEEAETIALTHAGLTAAEVVGLYTEYDIDDRISMYEIRFYHDHWEYEYDIHAKTGAILSFDKDN